MSYITIRNLRGLSISMDAVALEHRLSCYNRTLRTPLRQVGLNGLVVMGRRVIAPDPDWYSTYEEYEEACTEWEDAYWDAADEKHDRDLDD